MSTPLAQNKDFLAGLLFIFIGGIGLYVGMGYAFGSFDRMGPGFFPRILSVTLIGFGVVTMVRGLRSKTRVAGKWGWIPLGLLTAALVAFGWLMEHVGMIPALVALFFLSSYAGHEFKVKEVAILTVVMCAFATAVFVWGLGLPYALFGAGE
jgi:putative tricarboxylic transport membrane protein